MDPASGWRTRQRGATIQGGPLEEKGEGKGNWIVTFMEKVIMGEGGDLHNSNLLQACVYDFSRVGQTHIAHEYCVGQK